MNVSDDTWKALDEAYAQIEAGNLEQAEAGLTDIAKTAPDVPEVHFLLGNLAVERDELDVAIAAYSKAIALDQNYADAHHALADAARESGEEELALEHALKVWALDASADTELSESMLQQAFQMIEGEAERVLAALPDRFRDALADVPILIEERPTEELVREGVDPRCLGLFDGPGIEERNSTEAPPAPTQIVLYWTNILDVAEDDESLGEELEITLLHEIAHYFDLDEDEVAALGLA